MTTLIDNSFYLIAPPKLRLVVHGMRASIPAPQTTLTPEQHFAREIERAGHGRNWPYTIVFPKPVSVRTLRGIVERYGFARERIATTCTSEGDALMFASPGARAKHEFVRFGAADVDPTNAIVLGALAAAEGALGRPAHTAIRVQPTDRGAETVHRIAATTAREHEGVVVKWSGRTGSADDFTVIKP